MPTYFCKECDGNGYQQDGWDESDDAEERRRRARARRELRRARKARKNLVMYKMVGRRPWTRGTNVLDTPIIMAFLCSGRCPDWQCYCDIGDYVRTAHDNRLENLRQRSGFLAMSRRAEGMR